MSVTADKAAPYAPASAVIDLIQRHRNRGLPSPINAEVLARAGVSESLIPRTLQALIVLDLIDDQGAPSRTLEGIRLAPEAEYKQRLSEWLKSAYADVLKFVDPAMDDETRVRDAFRNYQPIGQQSRMITLFLGLMAAAGMAPEKAAGQRRTRVSAPGFRLNTSTQGKNGSATRKQEERSDPPPPPPPPPPKTPEISEKALEYRLVDLMSEAAGDPDVMGAIIKVITFLKTKNASNPAA